MLGLFSARVDHPLADAREAERLLGELPAQDAAAALDSATAWLDSLVATTEFKPDDRLDLILRIDAAVLPHTRRLAREYLTAARQTRAEEFRLWKLNQDYWHSLSVGYDESLHRLRDPGKVGEALRPQLGPLVARLLHALGHRLKWDHFRYGPIAGELWTRAGGAYLAAEQGQAAVRAVALYAGAGGTTPAAEYMRMLLFQASSMDNLLPVEIEIAERLIAHLVPNFSLTDQARPENVYWVDAAKPLPPTRLARIPEIAPTLRFFATAPGLAAIERLRAEIEARGGLPAEINFGGQYSPRLVLAVIDHLAACWAPVPPMRHHPRRPVKSRMIVVGGLQPTRRYLGSELLFGDDAESWVVEDVSQGGIGAQVSLVGKDWLKVGSLVGLQPEGGSNWLVGVVRRFVRESDAVGSVGIETLSKQPRGALADSRGLETEVVLLDPPAAGGELRLALSIAAWEEQQPLMVEIDGRRYRLFPQDRLETGAGHVVGTYRAEASLA